MRVAMTMVVLTTAALSAAENAAPDPRAPLRAYVGEWTWTAEAVLYGEEKPIGQGRDTFEMSAKGTVLRIHSQGVEFGMETEAEGWIGWDPAKQRYFYSQLSNIHQLPQIQWGDLRDGAFVIDSQKAKGFRGEDVEVTTRMSPVVDGTFEIVVDLTQPDGTLSVRMSYRYERVK